MNYNDFREMVQNTIQKIQEEVSKNPILEDENFIISYKIWHISHKEENTAPQIVSRLNNFLNTVLYDKASFYANIDYIEKAKAAFDKKVEELNPFKELSASSENLSLMLEQATKHKKEAQEKVESIIEKCNLTQTWVYNEENLRIVGQELRSLKHKYSEELQKYYASDILPDWLQTKQIREKVIEKIKESHPEFSVQIISQSIRYILTLESDILQGVLKDCKELGLEIKDENGKNWFMELQAAEKQARQASANKKALENILAETLNNSSATSSSDTSAPESVNEIDKILETLKNLVENHSSLNDKLVCFDKPDGTYSGSRISYFLNKSAEDIEPNAIPALQTFITSYALAASTTETSKMLEKLKNLVENHSSLKNEKVYFDNTGYIYIGYQISYFLDKNAEDIPVSAIPALQTFITEHDTTLSGVSIEFQI